MAQLEAFANRTVPVCVWQGNESHKALFQFLAVRFLLAADKVLDCERARQVELDLPGEKRSPDACYERLPPPDSALGRPLAGIP